MPALFRPARMGLGLLLCALYACLGGHETIGTDAASALEPNGQPASTSAPFVPAPHAALPQILKGAGAVLTKPVLQPIYFSDPNQVDLQTFATKLSASAYWSAVTSEYGVGPMTTAPAILADTVWQSSATDGELQDGQPSDIEALLVKQLDGPAPLWGAPSSNTVYVLYMPSGVSVSPDGGSTPSACAAHILAWHTAMRLPKSGVIIAYVVVPFCNAVASLNPVDSRTFAASHALVGAVTNPLLNGFNSFDPNHGAWQLAASGGEVGDACVAQQYDSNSLIAYPADVGFAVQRSWSNGAARAGHAPCLPAQGNVYFDAIPNLSTVVQATLSPDPLAPQSPTLGVKIAVGSSADVQLQLLSDGDTGGPWSVLATEMGTTDLSLSLNKNLGANGDTLTLHIIANKAEASQQNLVRIGSTLNGIQNNQFLLVHN